MTAHTAPDEPVRSGPNGPADAATHKSPDEVQFAEHNVLATFKDMDDARRALNALETRGIDAANVSLLGRAAQEAEREVDTRPREVRATGDVARRIAIGGAAGTAAGGAIGFLAGLIAFSIPGVGPVLGAGIWATTIGGGVAGGAVGGVVGGVSALPESQDWELTYEDVRQGRVLVGVHASDPEIVAKGDSVLKGLDPFRVERFDAKGRRIEADQ